MWLFYVKKISLNIRKRVIIMEKKYGFKNYNEDGLRLLNKKKYLLFKLYLKELEQVQREYVKKLK